MTKALPAQDEPVPSPCIRRCTLDRQDICVGCYRSLAEITRWNALDNEARRQILQRCASRARQRQSQ